jgi:hypothetical protein
MNQLALERRSDQMLNSESRLISAALALGAESVNRWCAAERRLAQSGRPRFDDATAAWFIRSIRRGEDPLGETFCRLRVPEVRRQKGAVYTPPAIVRAMVAWAEARGASPARIVDPGVGSARFLIAAAKAFPGAELVGVDIDPLATVLARGTLAAAGLADRSVVLLGDYRTIDLHPIDGQTLFIGNPPYIRHHVLDSSSKQWLTREASKLGHGSSQLAGMHVHFFLATALHGKPGDLGCFITAAEWLDVNYGSLLRNLFLRDLGGQSLTIVEPTAEPFADTAATAVISTFEFGSRPKSIRVKRVGASNLLMPLDGGGLVARSRLETETRWSRLTSPAREIPSGLVELGELCRVHRGQVTGANRIWIAEELKRDLPSSVLYPAVTRAKQLFDAGPVLSDCSALKRVIDLPSDLSIFRGKELRAIEEFLRKARLAGADRGYIASNRKVWWSVGLREPAPILATYMARRPPAFVRNRAEARHINIAHGLYPREDFGEKVLLALAAYLAKTTSMSDGRTYAGGLTKFEPREMERLLVPRPELLLQDGA